MPQSPAQTTERPRYRVLLKSFFAPHTIEPGTEIIYDGVPGNHLSPLNEAARLKMEEFFTTKFPERDLKGSLTGKTITPREAQRPVQYVGGSDFPIEVVAEPVSGPLAVEVQSLGEIMAARKPTDQRPPPAAVPASVPVDIKSE